MALNTLESAVSALEGRWQSVWHGEQGLQYPADPDILFQYDRRAGTRMLGLQRNASGYQEQSPNESDSIPKTGIELAYLPGSSVPRLMISI